MKKRVVLLRSDGRKQHYKVDYNKLKKKREYDRSKRAWVIKLPEDIKQTMLKLFEEKATPHYEYYVDKDGKQKRTIIGIKGYNNMHFKRDLDADLEKAQVQDEGDGWYQLNAYTGNTAKSAPVKIKYNPKQKLLEVTIRDYKL